VLSVMAPLLHKSAAQQYSSLHAFDVCKASTPAYMRVWSLNTADMQGTTQTVSTQVPCIASCHSGAFFC
jgi:hypothetical protein